MNLIPYTLGIKYDRLLDISSEFKTVKLCLKIDLVLSSPIGGVGKYG